MFLGTWGKLDNQKGTCMDTENMSRNSIQIINQVQTRNQDFFFFNFESLTLYLLYLIIKLIKILSGFWTGVCHMKLMNRHFVGKFSVAVQSTIVHLCSSDFGL